MNRITKRRIIVLSLVTLALMVGLQGAGPGTGHHGRGHRAMELDRVPPSRGDLVRRRRQHARLKGGGCGEL